MKKQFLTFALLATVAVGSAVAQIQLYDATGNPVAFCAENGTISCSELEGPLYDENEDFVQPTEYESLFYFD